MHLGLLHLNLLGFFTLLGFLSFYSQGLMAHDLSVKIKSKMSNAEKLSLEMALAEVSALLPQKFKDGLPKNIEIKFEKLSSVKEMPSDICKGTAPSLGEDHTDFPGEEKKFLSNAKFVYGIYQLRTNTLKLDSALLNELLKGRSASQKIECQHKNLYDQAIGTIIHELTHAYDFNNKNPSLSNHFYELAGFKRGLIKTKNKNINAMRSLDAYELSNSIEAYALNMEYFSMDPEFACRRPALFEFYKNKFEVDPFPNRKCRPNRSVMMSTSSGYFPVELDARRIYRIDYLMASPGKELSSGFGHSMFRIIMCAPERTDIITNKIIPATPFGEKCAQDKLFHLVVSYRANVEGATLSYIKGLFGGYPSMLFILSFGDVLDEYNRDELRDVVSYPLKLSALEKEDLVNKILEEHWNYRGAYKFITNNCAVESYDLLKSALERSELQKFSSVTPNGVLKDLGKLDFLSLSKDRHENYPARTEILLQSLAYAYGYKSKGPKKDNDYLLKFINEGQIKDREMAFGQFLQKRDSLTVRHSDLHAELMYLKNLLLTSSSFSVMEQQILRKKGLDFRKKIADAMYSNKDEKIKMIKEVFKEVGASANLDFASMATSGYGVPLKEEMKGQQGIETQLESAKEAGSKLEKMIKDYMPKEVKELDRINADIKEYNSVSHAIRKEFKEKLDVYIEKSIRDLSLQEEGRETLMAALSSPEGMNELRSQLDVNLVSTKEILDNKLMKMIDSVLKE